MKNISIKPKLPPYYPLKCFYVDGNQLIASSGYTNQHVINLERIINNSSGHYDRRKNKNKAIVSMDEIPIKQPWEK